MKKFYIIYYTYVKGYNKIINNILIQINNYYIKEIINIDYFNIYHHKNSWLKYLLEKSDNLFIFLYYPNL